MLSGNGLTFSRFIIAVNRTDMRLGIDGLAALIRMKYGMDSLEKGTLFLFCGRKKDRVKGLVWTGDRFIMIYIRLAEGRFQWPKTEDEARKLSVEEFNRLMDGYSIDPSIGPKRINGQPSPVSLRKS